MCLNSKQCFIISLTIGIMFVVAACSLFFTAIITISKYENLFVLLSVVSLGIGTFTIIFTLIFGTFTCVRIEPTGYYSPSYISTNV